MSSADSGIESAAEEYGDAIAIPVMQKEEPIDQAQHVDAGEHEGEDGLDLLQQRAQRNMHTVWSNGLFTLSNDPNTRYVRVRMLPRWQHKNLLGVDDTNKALTPTNFGEDALHPVKCYTALRAWMIARLEAAPAFINARSSRTRLLANEKQQFREELRRFSTTMDTTCSPKLDKLILSWWPQAFAA